MFKFRGGCESGMQIRQISNDHTIETNEVTFWVPRAFEIGQIVKIFVDLKKNRVFLFSPGGKKRRLYPQKLFVNNPA